jgi:hypothetical protein
MRQIAFHPSDPQVIALRYDEGDGGMLFTRDGGKSWQLACAALLFDPVATHTGPIALANDGSTWMSVQRGLWHDDGHGCGWQNQPEYAGTWMADLAPHPSDPDVLFALTSTAAATGGQFDPTGVVRRDASGAWSNVGERARVYSQELRVAALGAGVRLYVGAIAGVTTAADGGPARVRYVTRVSDDDAKTWSEHEVDIGAGPSVFDGLFHLVAVDPANPDRVVGMIKRGRSNGDPPRADDDSVIVSTDQGVHFTEYLRVGEFGGLTFAPDGRLWIGDIGNLDEMADDAPRGLWFASSLAEAAQKVSSVTYPVYCLAYQKASTTLYGCQKYAFGTIDAAGGAFSPLMQFGKVQTLVTCEGMDVPGMCEMQLCRAWCGAQHFAQAPLCSVYDTPACGKPIALAEAMGNPSPDAGVDASVGGGVSGSPGTAMQDAGGKQERDAGKKDGGGKRGSDAGTQRAPPKHSDSGCSVTHPAGVTAVARAPTLLAVSALVLARRRRRERSS